MLNVVRGWGAEFVVSRGRKVFPQELPGLLAESDDGRKIGLITWEIIRNQCEIVTLDAFEKYCGIGTALIEEVSEIAVQSQCVRLWLITTNDNIDAIRFYQRRGFSIAAVHTNALKQSRKIKPSIPRIGQYGIPLRDEIELEIHL